MLSRIRKILAFTYRNYLFAKKNVFSFVEVLFWPAINVISVGMMGNFLTLNQSMKSFLLTGAIATGVLQVTQLDVAYGLLYDVWSKSLKQTFVAPITHFDYIIGSWLFGMVRGLLVFVGLWIFSALAFKFYLPAAEVVIITMIGFYLSALIIGSMIIFTILFFGSRMMELTWIMVWVIMLICGIYYPVSSLPKAFEFLASLVPLTYFLEYFRSGYGFKPVFTHSLLKGFALSFAYIGITFFMLDLAHKRARKSGMIIRLSE